MNQRDNLWGIGEGKRKARIEEEKRKTALLESDLRIKELQSGVLSDKQVEALSISSEGKLYLILGIAIVAIVIAIIIIKRKKKS